jgi:hypothetical protein
MPAAPTIAPRNRLKRVRRTSRSTLSICQIAEPGGQEGPDRAHRRPLHSKKNEKLCNSRKNAKWRGVTHIPNLLLQCRLEVALG